MGIRLNKWGVVEHLKSEEDMALYLEACFEGDPGDGSLIRAALRDIARARGMAQLVEDVALAEQRLEALRAGRGRTLTLEEVERELGLEH